MTLISSHCSLRLGLRKGARMRQISATFEIKGWDEQLFDERIDLAKLTRTSVAKQYAGDIEGSSTTEWLMALRTRPFGGDRWTRAHKGDDRRTPRQSSGATSRQIRGR
jgi:Protein of unknown function (DUF3224)